MSWTAGVLTRTEEEPPPTHDDPRDRPDWWHKFCDARGGGKCKQTSGVEKEEEEEEEKEEKEEEEEAEEKEEEEEAEEV